MVAVESKLTEPLQPTLLLARLCRADSRRPACRRLVSRDGDRACPIGQLQVARRCAADQARLWPRALLQGAAGDAPDLYWEPLDADRDPVMLAHRHEIEGFARLVTGGFPHSAPRAAGICGRNGSRRRDRPGSRITSAICGRATGSAGRRCAGLRSLIARYRRGGRRWRAAWRRRWRTRSGRRGRPP